MQYLVYKSITYVLSEEQGLSGKIVCEFLQRILCEKDSLLFSCESAKEIKHSMELLKQQCKETYPLPNESKKNGFVGSTLAMNKETIDILCALGEYPNCMSISKVNTDSNGCSSNYLWTIEYCDEVITLTFVDKLFSDETISLIEDELVKKQLNFERKTIKTIKKKLGTI